MKQKRLLNRGQSLVELALILPLLLLILVILFDLGRAVYFYSVIHNAAREGARYGIIDNTPGIGCETPRAGIEAHVFELTVGLPNDPTVVSMCVGSKIQVDVTYEYVPVTPLADSFLEDGDGDGQGEIMLHSTSSMNVEG